MLIDFKKAFDSVSWTFNLYLSNLFFYNSILYRLLPSGTLQIIKLLNLQFSQIKTVSDTCTI